MTQDAAFRVAEQSVDTGGECLGILDGDYHAGIKQFSAMPSDDKTKSVWKHRFHLYSVIQRILHQRNRIPEMFFKTSD